MENKLIHASMIEVREFMELSEKYGVTGVPRTVINDTVLLEGEGAHPEETPLKHVLKAVSG